MRWYDANRRDLPWRESQDFYGVWISEIMLQQTRVEAVVPYYHRFLERFPTMNDLAAAPEPEVLAAWSGLGYYSRARNLHRAAKQLAATQLPSTHEEVLALPGAGPYTAAAIASIALNLPHAAVDGNVMRVISRIANDASEITSPLARREFAARAEELLDRKRPGDFNQAMMELGATICTPRNPACPECPVMKFCAARAAGTERELPVKLKKQQTRDVLLDLVMLRRGDSVWLMKRSSSEKRLAGFWELPEKNVLAKSVPVKKLCEFRHQIVNDRYHVTVWTARAAKTMSDLPDGKWFAVPDLTGIPLTTVTKKALASTSL
jgi:A/G-specific adenine glycosylase